MTLRLGRAAALCLAPLLVAPVARAGAQAAPPPPAVGAAVLLGRVAADSAGTAVHGAEVTASGYGIRTDADGRFTLAVPPGTHDVVVRLPGRTPWRATRTLAAGDTLRLDVVLPPLAQALDAVTVTRRSRAASARFVGFERRRELGFGHFQGREELERRENSKMSDVLRGVPGLRFIYLPNGRGIAVASNRFAGNLPGSRRRTDQCFMQLFVDGVKVFDSSASERGGPGLGAAVEPPSINDFAISDIEGIEVYRGPGETPPEFGGTNAMCGTVAIWTRAGR